MSDYSKRLDEILKSDACKCFAEAVEAVAIAKVLLKEAEAQKAQAERWHNVHGFLEDSCRRVIDGKATMRRLGDRIEFTMVGGLG